MAESTTRELGNDELVYVATSAPTDATDKDDAAYDIVGLQTSFQYQINGQTTEIRDKRGATTKAGSNTRTATLGVNTSHIADDGQGILNTAAETESGSKSTLYFLITSGVTGQRYRHFQAQVNSMNDQAPTDQAATIEYGLNLTNTPTTGVLSA